MSDRLLTPHEAAQILDKTEAELAALRAADRAPENYEITPRIIRYSSASVQEYRREELHRSE